MHPLNFIISFYSRKVTRIFFSCSVSDSVSIPKKQTVAAFYLFTFLTHLT